MSIPYRTRRSLKTFFVTVLVLILVAVMGLLGWLIWLNRYVVYSRDGAKLDFSLNLDFGPGVKPVPPEPGETVQVHDKVDPNDPELIQKELVRFSGYYVTLEDLTGDFDAVAQQLSQLPRGSTVLLELKDVRGYVYYSSEYGKQSKDFDSKKVDQLLKDLKSWGHYVIVKIPAFQEYHFFMDDERGRVPYGLPKTGGNGSLWLDRSGPCYWLNPASDGTLTYLIQLVTQLRSMGVDEVVFSDFRFPETDQIRFEGDKDQALNDCATTLVKTCATDRFCVSFERTQADLTLPEGRTRLYLTGVSAADAATQAGKTDFADPSVQVVFLTELSDTRYDDYCVLRPLGSAH